MLKGDEVLYKAQRVINQPVPDTAFWLKRRGGNIGERHFEGGVCHVKAIHG